MIESKRHCMLRNYEKHSKGDYNETINISLFWPKSILEKLAISVHNSQKVTHLPIHLITPSNKMRHDDSFMNEQKWLRWQIRTIAYRPMLLSNFPCFQFSLLIFPFPFENLTTLNNIIPRKETRNLQSKIVHWHS